MAASSNTLISSAKVRRCAGMASPNPPPRPETLDVTPALVSACNVFDK